ncbi:MAG: GTPase ObgE [Candidatus Saccharibacteria bacterium]|nr:GTPase ObgE [Candidatus Saccharibacteria bacterium]
MFIDKATVKVSAGDGGNGRVNFRHEKFVDRGGPDGGDGGDGGDIIMVASRNQNTLASFRYHKELLAEPGKPGDKQNKHGKSGKDLTIQVPVGTLVSNADGLVLADFVADQQTAIIAHGGKGGFGNAHFVSSRRQAPRVAEKGERGDELELTLELKVIADVGIVGMPNAGKSTLLASVSNARPEIADYAFTTLTPNLGVVDLDKGNSLLLADVPGLIEGASEGKGLGDEFLRHVERTGVLIHLIDAYQDDVVAVYKTIQNELKSYTVDLSEKPQAVVLNKIDGLDPKVLVEKQKALKKVIPKGTMQYAISAVSGEGVKPMLYELKKLVDIQRAIKKEAEAEDMIPTLRLPETLNSWNVSKVDDHFLVKGRKIERFAERTDFESNHGIERLRDIMGKMGIMHQLRRMDVEPDQKVIIGDPAIGSIKY